MIPKLIHYCWFGPNKKSDLNIRCIESWEKYLSDFEIKEWNETNFPIDDYPFAKEAYSQGKYAFVADVARLYALQKEGGVYLDTDMEILKPIHHLLENTAFVGFESKEWIAVGIIGSVPSGHFINLLLNHYKTCPFSTITQPYIATSILGKIGFDIDGESQTITDFLTVYSEDYFYPYSYYTKKMHFTENTRCLHHYEGSWQEEKFRKCYKPKSLCL
jgi:mannosyltransferase OCH1-like enzyme